VLLGRRQCESVAEFPVVVGNNNLLAAVRLEETLAALSRKPISTGLKLYKHVLCFIEVSNLFIF